MGLKNIADNRNPESVASRMRRKRFQHVLDIIDRLQKPVKVLDVGGTVGYWRNMNVDMEGLEVTLINMQAHVLEDENFTGVQGDARDLSRWEDNAFDLVFSNSVIEHVGGYEDMQRMAAEVRRVGRNYVVQTPNKYFPIEPHFLFPLFQFLPRWLQTWLLKTFTLGYRTEPCPTTEIAHAEIDDIQLLSFRRFRSLFPGARFEKEKVLFLTKSFLAIDGPETTIGSIPPQ